MPIPYNSHLFLYTKKLRHDMTQEEKKLWYQFLKRLPITVKRQQPMLNYILDFYIDSKKLAIELDGRQHFTYEHRFADQKRDADLQKWGILVLRYSNDSIHHDFTMVCNDIMRNIQSR